MITRRSAATLFAGTALGAALGLPTIAEADDKVIIIGINLPITGADAAGAKRIMNGAMLGISQANDANAIPGYTLKPMMLNDATATAGQYDPAQAATNARKFVSNPKVLAAIGPEMSGSAKAMTPILSEGNLAIITPSATNPDLTNPQFAAQYMPGGKPVFFRTRHDGRLPGSEHGELLCRDPGPQGRLYPGRQRRLRRGSCRRLREALRRQGAEGSGPRPPRPDGRPTTRRC